MQTAGAETNVPLLVATVFGATFLIVGAIAYLVLFRRTPSRTTPPAPLTHTAPPAPLTHTVPPAPPDNAPVDQPADTTQITLPLDELGAPPSPAPVLAAAEPAATTAPSSAADISPAVGRQVFVPLYRALMFATGLAGLLASALMFSAVEGVSILLFIALAIAAFSVYSIYRGFVPDAELRQPPRR